MAVQLKDLIKGKKTVMGIELYPLTIADITYLITSHKEAVIALFSNRDFMSVVTSFPEFIAAIIAKGTRSTEEVAAQVPAGKQLELLVGIWELSEINPDLLGNLIRSITSNLQIMSAALMPGKT